MILANILSLNNIILIEGLGLTAGVLTTIATIPQLIQLYRTRLSRDVSAKMYFIYSIGLFLWIIYGIICESFSLVFTSIISLIIAIFILILKLKWRNNA